jgi:hypothetical protein
MEQRFILKVGKRHGAVAAIAFVKGSFYSKEKKMTIPTADLLTLIGLSEKDTPEKPSYVASWQAAEQDMRNLTKEAL